MDAAALETDVPYRSTLETLAGALPAEYVQLCYQIALQGRADLSLAPDEHAGFVMTLLRMLAFRPEGALTAEDEPARRPLSSSRCLRRCVTLVLRSRLK